MRVAVVLCCALCIGAEPLRFGSFSLDAGISGLLEQYPASDHQFWLPDGHAVGSTESGAEFRYLLAHRTGRYSIRMLPQETRREVYYLEAGIEQGVVKSIRLSFEKPASPKSTQSALGDFEERHPPCSPVLASLTRQYGRPEEPVNSSEERLENRKYVWKNDRQELTLVCGRYQGRAKVFAMDVILTRLGN